jgi:hypothetical protein
MRLALLVAFAQEASLLQLRKSGMLVPPDAATAGAISRMLPGTTAAHLQNWDGNSTYACDGSRLIFVGGYHHGGTTIIQQQLLTHLNQSLDDSGQDERWPHHFLNEVCADSGWSIFKHPTNSPGEVAQMLSYRARFPQSRLVFVTRDLPNTVWSVMKRVGSNETAVGWVIAQQWCDVNSYYVEHSVQSARDWAVPLSTFTELHEHMISAVLGRHGALNLSTVRLQDSIGVAHGQVAEAGPSHKQYRMQQATEAVYPYDATVFSREAPPDVASFLQHLTCE